MLPLLRSPRGLLLGSALLFTSNAFAGEQPDVQPPIQQSPLQQVSPSPSQTQPAENPAPPADLLAYVDAPRDYLSGKLVGFASSMDRFFGDERNYQETNKSLVQLDLVRVLGYGDEHRFALTGKAKLHLPSTEKRMHLMLETNPDKNVTGESRQTPPPGALAGTESYSAAVRYEKEEERRWNLSSDLGLKFQGLNSNLFARARGSYAIPVGEWRLKAAETLFWFNTTGAGETTQLDAERILSEPLLFRSTSNATWLNDKQNFDLRQDMTVYHALNERTAMLYQASATGVSQPQTQVTEYVLLVSYRYRLHKSWIFFDASPQLHFPRIRNFQTSPALILRLEMLFDKPD